MKRSVLYLALTLLSAAAGLILAKRFQTDLEIRLPDERMEKTGAEPGKDVKRCCQIKRYRS